MTWVPCANIILGESDYKIGAPISTYMPVLVSTSTIVPIVRIISYHLHTNYLYYHNGTTIIFPIQYDF